MNLFRSSAPESAVVKIGEDEKELNEAEKFILKDVDLILDLRKSNEGNAALREKLIDTGFQVQVNDIPESFKPGQRYLLQVDYLGKGDEVMAFIDQKWLGTDELKGLNEKQAFVKRRSLFNSQGLAGLNILLLERKASMAAVLKLLTHYLEQVPAGRILVHCTAGKDRTGMVCMLLQSIAGFSLEQLAAEYMISEAEAKHILAMTLNDHDASFLDPAIMSGADRAGFDGVISHIQATYGGIEDYMDEIGFDIGWRERLKKALL